MAISTDNIELLKKDKSLEALKLLLEHFKEDYNLDEEQILRLISGNKEVKQDSIPLTAFANEKLSSLEIIVKYLKEEREKTNHQIAVLLNRNDRTIWSTYSNSLKKYKPKLSYISGEIIPVDIFSSRKNSVLGSLVSYLKDKLGYSFSKISVLLMKDYQTIYTTYRRGVLK